MRNFLCIALLALIVFGCGQSGSHQSNSLPEKQPTSVNPKTDNEDGSLALTSKITCPKCGHTAQEQMPTDVCQIAYTCKKCKAVLNPKKGDCCVFCTYGDHKCPSKQ